MIVENLLSFKIKHLFLSQPCIFCLEFPSGLTIHIFLVNTNVVGLNAWDWPLPFLNFDLTLLFIYFMNV